MRTSFRFATVTLGTICLIMVALSSAQNSTPTPIEPPVTNHATGPFDVKLTPQNDKYAGPPLGRMTLDKHFHGDLEATSEGQMLSVTTEVKGSAGYVAIERVTGTLQGRTGSFVLQHSATMNRSTPHLLITVVPDSGTGQLEGINGKMTINIAADGKHSYDFEYTLPKTD